MYKSEDGSGKTLLSHRMRGCLPYLLGAAVILGMFWILFQIAFCGSFSTKTYEEAKTQSVKRWNKRKEEFVQIAEDGIKNGTVEGAEIHWVRDSIYLHGDEQGRVRAVVFSIDTQGVMDVETWGVYYSSDDQPQNIGSYEGHFEKGPRDDAYYMEKDEYFYATEKIEDKWYFFYMDYDGSKHGLDWGEA